MAKTIVMSPPAELEQRESDVPIAAERFLKFSLFARLAKKPTVEKFPGTLALRRFRRGEVICRQGASGWTAFYLLTTEDVLERRKEQLQVASAQDNSSVLREEIDQLERLRTELKREPGNRVPRATATVYLTSARQVRIGMGGFLERLSPMILRRTASMADRLPL